MVLSPLDVAVYRLFEIHISHPPRHLLDNILIVLFSASHSQHCLRGHVHMTSAKFSIFSPSSPLVTVTLTQLMGAIIWFWGTPPLLSQCGHQMYMPPFGELMFSFDPWRLDGMWLTGMSRLSLSGHIFTFALPAAKPSWPFGHSGSVWEGGGGLMLEASLFGHCPLVPFFDAYLLLARGTAPAR